MADGIVGIDDMQKIEEVLFQKEEAFLSAFLNIVNEMAKSQMYWAETMFVAKENDDG